MKNAILAVVALFTLLGCSESATEPGGSIVGVWALTAVDDQPLPYMEAPDRSVTAGAMRFEADRTGEFRYCRHYATGPGAGTYEFADDFTWSLSGSTVTVNFLFTTIQTDQAVLSGNTLVLNRTFEVPDRFYRFTKGGSMPSC